jgi:hypothetical protein
LKETEGSHHKQGSTKKGKDTTVCAGYRYRQAQADVAIEGGAERVQIDNKS